MTPWVQQEISEEEFSIFSRITKIVNSFPDDVDLGIDRDGERIILSCHILSKAVVEVFNDMICIDGYFYPSFQHSWLKTFRGNIIDVYPPGILNGPIFIESEYGPGRFLYKSDVSVLKTVIDRIGKKQFEMAVGRVVKMIKALTDKMDIDSLMFLTSESSKRVLVDDKVKRRRENNSRHKAAFC